MKIFCVLCATACPIFEVKVKFDVSVPSGFKNQPKMISTVVVHSDARTRFDGDTCNDRNRASNTLVSCLNAHSYRRQSEALKTIDERGSKP